MSLYDANSDCDYDDEHGPRPVRCMTAGCDGYVTFPDFEVRCGECLQKQAERNAQHRAELAQAGPVKVRIGDRRIGDRRQSDRRRA